MRIQSRMGLDWAMVLGFPTPYLTSVDRVRDMHLLRSVKKASEGQRVAREWAG